MQKRMKYDWNNKEQFIEDLKNSYSMSDFLSKQKFSSITGNARTFKEKVELHNIDLENIYLKRNFIPRSRLEQNNYPTIEEVLCLNSPYKNKKNFIKKYIRENNLIQYECTGCDNNGFWQGKDLVLELEHKNGNNSDNRLENLEYLCPNCHSQTSTYRSKNIHNKIFDKRILDLQKFEIINNDNVNSFASLWNIKVISVKDWIFSYRNKIESYGVVVNITENVFIKKEKIIKDILTSAKENNNSLADIAIKMNLSEKDTLKIIKIYDNDLFIILNDNSLIHKKNDPQSAKLQDLKNVSVENYLEILPSLWNMNDKDTILWIKQNDYNFYVSILKFENKQYKIKSAQLKIENEIKRIEDIESRLPRFTQVAQLTNKKEVPRLAEEWKVSSTAVKKWIRNNMPEKFAEIYDDNLLEKNKKLAQKNSKKSYFQSLSFDTFNLEEIMEHLHLNKASLYALIKQHNPQLYEQLMPAVVCKYCESKTRTSGSYQDNIRYRCLSVDCGKSFFKHS